MFDIDSRTILAEFDVDAYIFSTVLDGMLSWCPIIRNDKIIQGLYDAMRFRVEELLSWPDEEVEKFLVCGFSKQLP